MPAVAGLTAFGLLARSVPWLRLAQPAVATLAVAPTGVVAENAGAGYTPLLRGTVTYNKDIAPIVYQNCAPCHRPGEVAPFSLLSYADAKKRARLIATVTHSRTMPPWKADAGADEFLDAHVLADPQIAAIRQWAEQGAVEGNPADLPAAPRFTAGWTLGEPDVVFEPEQSYDLAADGADVYRCFVLPTKYTEDRYIAAMEVRPGNRAVVHHVIAFLDTSGRARQLDEQGPGPGYTSFGGIGVPPSGGLGGWAPGNFPTRLPDGIGTLLPRGADIVLQVHYHKSGKPETDRTRIGLYFCQGPVDKRLRVAPLIQLGLHIPPGDANYQARASLPVPGDVTVRYVMPHMHLLGREMTVSATLPDNSEKKLVRVPDWDFNWQNTYALRNPLKLPGGSRIDLLARYDNTEQNVANPNNPPRMVTWGEATTSEMCIAFVFYTVDAEHLTKGEPARGFPEGFFSGDGQQLAQQLKEMFDKDGDGKLDADEQAAAMKYLQERMQDRSRAGQQ